MTAQSSAAPSEVAMRRFVEQSPGLRTARLAKNDPRLPTLPDLKKIARDRRDAGHDVIDQSAGDIDDVGQPLSEEFMTWVEESRDRLIAEGHSLFARVPGNPFGYPGNYQQQYPVVTDTLARSWGIANTPVRALQTPSGRIVLDFTMRGLIARARASGKQGPFAIVLDPLAWSGYAPLAAALELGIVHAPAVPELGLANSAESLEAAFDRAREEGLTPVAAITVLPSNPTGVGMPRDELGRFIETGAAADVPILIDAFYSPIAPEGHAEAVPLGWLEGKLASEVLAYLGVVVGETKVTSSQNKTGSLLWLAPAGAKDQIADAVVNTAAKRMRATNSYPRPQEALVAFALHTFPGGIHAAMGPRYEALHGARVAMRAAFDEFELPLTIGGSFYGTAALVDKDGESLLRDADGRPLADPRAMSEALTGRFGIVGAPGGMFSSAPEANKMVRLTAAVTLKDVEKLRAIIARMVDEAG